VSVVGKGNKAAPLGHIKERHRYIKDAITSRRMSGASKIPLIYGGNVSPENVKGIMGLEEVDGVLVGGCSLKPDEFAKIVNYQ